MQEALRKHLIHSLPLTPSLSDDRKRQKWTPSFFPTLPGLGYKVYILCILKAIILILPPKEFSFPYNCVHYESLTKRNILVGRECYKIL